jgi:hypothetical protein
VAAHATVVQPSAAGFVSLWPADYPHGMVSAVNFAAGATRGNSLVLPLSTDGAARLKAGLPASEPVLVDAFDPASETVRLVLTAVNFAGEGPGSAAVSVSHPN